MLPLAGVLEQLVNRLVPDAVHREEQPDLDERLLATPAIALERCREVAVSMAKLSVLSLKEAMKALEAYGPELARQVRNKEEKTDYYEDILGTYLVRLSAKPISQEDSGEAARLLKVIGDFERISDHAVNLLEAAEEMADRGMEFTDPAAAELDILSAAVREILDLALRAFLENDRQAASLVEPLEQVIDRLKEQMRTRHILRMQHGRCSMDAGFVWSDLLTNLERTADHCSNIAGCVLDMADHSLSLHQTLRGVRNDSREFRERFREYAEKYSFGGIEEAVQPGYLLRTDEK
jgi:phosphate:Na+ symporter